MPVATSWSTGTPDTKPPVLGALTGTPMVCGRVAWTTAECVETTDSKLMRPGCTRRASTPTTAQDVTQELHIKIYSVCQARRVQAWLSACSWWCFWRASIMCSCSRCSSSWCGLEALCATVGCPWCPSVHSSGVCRLDTHNRMPNTKNQQRMILAIVWTFPTATEETLVLHTTFEWTMAPAKATKAEIPKLKPTMLCHTYPCSA
mmetsp:Transcript_42029/g.111210  ORF Transcript_42029/g.111210 Transcript_42029/m.111210 type:complete len:204 (+) Transcript_42029:172-783(+)